jgi:hypothetical protein
MRSEMEEIKWRLRPRLTFCTTADPVGRSVPKIEDGGLDAYVVDVEHGHSGRGRPRRVAAHLLLVGSSHGNSSSEENEGGSASRGGSAQLRNCETGIQCLLAGVRREST